MDRSFVLNFYPAERQLFTGIVPEALRTSVPSPKGRETRVESKEGCYADPIIILGKPRFVQAVQL